MRIGFFTSVDGWGGSEMYLRSLMMRIRDLGHGVVLFGIGGTRLFRDATEGGIKCISWRTSRWIGPALTGEGSKGDGPVRPGRGFRKSILRMSPSGVAHILRDCSKVVALSHLFSNERVDVMHVNINTYEVAGIACKLTGIPCLAMCCLSPEKNEDHLRGWLTRWTPRFYTVVASKSRTCMNAWQQYCNLSASRCRFIWNGVDLKKFRYQERVRVTQGRPFRLLAVARLDPIKGLDVLIRAMSLLRDKDVVLSIAGHGAKDEQEALEGLIGDLNVSSKVKLLGYVEDVAALYRETDCTVMASVMGESFGQTLIEAMASGSPLITSDLGPFLEINKHNITGLVVPKGDATSLAKAINKMLEDEGSRIRMGRRGRERAERLFSLDRMIRETVNLYSEVAAGDPVGLRKTIP